MSDVNKITWEELHPEWIDEGDLTHYFAKSQFAGCPGCGKVEQLSVLNASQDDITANVICDPCGFVAWGDSPSQAIERWNNRIEDTELAALRAKLDVAVEALEREPMVYSVIMQSGEGRQFIAYLDGKMPKLLPARKGETK